MPCCGCAELGGHRQERGNDRSNKEVASTSRSTHTHTPCHVGTHVDSIHRRLLLQPFCVYNIVCVLRKSVVVKLRALVRTVSGLDLVKAEDRARVDLAAKAHVVAPWGCASLKLSIPLFRSSSFVSSLPRPPPSPHSLQLSRFFAGARDAPLCDYLSPPAPVLILQQLDRLCPRPTTLHTLVRFFVTRGCSARPSLAPCLLQMTIHLLRKEKIKVSLPARQQTLFARATSISPFTRPSPSTFLPYSTLLPTQSAPFSVSQLVQVCQRSDMANHDAPIAKSNEQITKEEDKKMDAENPSNGHVEPGISIRMGPVDNDKMDIDAPETNGNAAGKRKSRSSITNGKSYKDASSSEEDDKPLVRSFVRSACALRPANP